MQGKKYKKLLSDTLLFSISNFGSKVLVFLLVPIYTNVLSTTEYGIVDLIVSTVNLLVPVLTISIAEGVLRFAFDKDVKKEQLLLIAMLITAVSTLALFFLKPVAVLIKEQVGQYWGYLVLIYLLNALNAIFSSYTRGLDKTRLFAVKGIVYTASLIIFNILFLLVFKMGLRGYLFALIITEIITILVMVLAGKYLPELTHFSFNKKLFREILGYSLPMIPTVIAWWVMQLSDKYVIIAAVGIAASGVYSVAYKIPSILATFTSIFTQAWQISAIKSHGDSDNKSFVENVYKYFIIVSVLLCSGLILASKVLGHILYAKDYFIAWTYVPILLVAYHFSGLSGVLASVYSASKKTIMLFVSTSVGAVINIVLNIILIPKFGAAAAAYTTLLGFFITWVVREINVRKLIKIELSHLKFGLSFTLLLAEAVIMSAQCRFMYPISAAITLLQCALFIPEIKFICVKIVGVLNMRRSKKTRNKRKYRRQFALGGLEMSYFKDKTLLITGGTGSFGNAVLNRFLDTDVGEIRIFSRDEKKQDDMRHDYQARFPETSEKIKFYIGDVRDLQSVKNAMHGVDFIFHAAALKQVPSCEFFPVEAVKTNVLGTENVLTAAIENGVKRVICLSTDKAAYPVNAMGTSKAMMEKVVVAKSRTVKPEKTTICCTRYGNVMCSRGSVIPLWIEQIKAGKPITITEPSMTRFIMSLDEAVDLVLFAFENGESGDILVQKAPACTIEVLARAVVGLFESDTEIKIIGIRHGEKMYETLLTNEECAGAVDMGMFYRVPCDKRDLNYDKYFKDGNKERSQITEFNSNNTALLGVEEVQKKLLSLRYIRDELEAWREHK